MRTIFSVFILSLPFFLVHTAMGQALSIQPYLQDASPSSMTIMWEADGTGTGQVNYGLSPFDLSEIVTSTTVSSSANYFIHTAVVSGLSPNTKYYYQVEMQDGTTTLVRSWKTPPTISSEEAVRLVAMSDMQRDGSHPNKFKEITEEGVITTMHELYDNDIHQLHGLLIPGDLVPTGGNYSHWQDYFFGQGDSLFSYVPLYPVLGNHEYFGSGGQGHFLNLFTLPTNGPSGLQERAWYKDISNLRIIGIDSNANGTEQDEQLTWLETVLDQSCTDPSIDFVFAQLHHPHLSELWTPGESNFTGEVIALLESFTNDCNKASIHFFGHTHGYSRGHSADSQHLWVNVATAGGAIDNWGEFPNADYEEFVKSQDEYGFVLVEVQAGIDPSFTLRRYGRGDQDVVQDNVVRDSLTIYNYENGPHTPTNIYPVGYTISAACITLKASEFDDSEDEHQASQWQIATDVSFSDVVFDSWRQSENYYDEVNTQAGDDLTDENVPALSSDSYYWRVRYRDQYLKWSDWSATSSFTVSGIDTLTTNLIDNGNAENGITSWTGDIESLTNAECNSVLPYEGSANFGVGGICANESNLGTAYQDVDLTAYAADIDADTRAIIYGAYLRNFSGNDLPSFWLEFYDGSNNLISSSMEISHMEDIWTLKSDIVDIPVGTRSVRLVLQGIRNAGGDNDSYFDQIELYVGAQSECSDCIGQSGIDIDGDGYCNDIDCNDDMATIYPGAREICDQLDNNCDGFVDSGDTVRWIGNGALPLWSDAKNWDQNITPLPCQYVIIDANTTVEVDGSFSCKGIKIEDNTTLDIAHQNTLLINNELTGSDDAIVVQGQLDINGKCIVKNAAVASVQVEGTIHNLGKLILQNSTAESIWIRSGGSFTDDGEVYIYDE